jgi:hypothetical protein
MDAHFHFDCIKAETMPKFRSTFFEESKMTEESITNECADPTQTLTVELPCQMVERVERYAMENETSLTGVLIEALDSFLRKPK